MASGKEAIAIIVDVSASMGTTTALNDARIAIKMFIMQKMMFSSKDVISLILFGTDETDNAVNASKGDYMHITTCRELDPADLNLVRFVDSLESENGTADLLDAIIVGLDLIERHTRGKKSFASKSVYAYTNGDMDLGDLDDSSVVSDAIKTNDTNFRVIGVGGFCSGDDKIKLSKQQKLAEGFISDFVANCGGDIFSNEELMTVLNRNRSRVVSQTTKSRPALDFFGLFSIPVQCFLKTKPETIPTLKSESTKAPKGSTGTVKLCRSYRPADDLQGLEEDTQPEDRVKAYAYGKELIVASDADMHIESGERRMIVMGVVTKDNFPRHHILGQTEIVSPDPKCPWALSAICALAGAIDAARSAFLVEYVWRKNAAPVLALLTAAHDLASFFLNFVPYSEDIRKLPPPPQLPPPTSDQLDGIDALIDSMQIESFPLDEMFNPALQRFYRAVTERALTPGSKIAPCDPKLERVLHRSPAFDERLDAAGLPTRLANVFAFKATQPTGKRRLWKDAIERQEGEIARQPPIDLSAIEIGVKMKKIKIDEENSPAAKAQKMFVGRVDPVGDFEKMMDERGADLSSKAIAEMIQIIDDLVETSLGKQNFPKAQNCFSSLRSACVKDREPAKFNSFLESLQSRSQHDKPIKLFWDILRADISNGIITSDECGESSKTREDAESLFQDAAIDSRPDEVVETEGDLFDIIE